MSNSFDDWWNEIENSSTRNDRFFDEFNLSHMPTYARHVEWMKACWNAAIEAAQAELATEAYYWVDFYEHGNSYPEQQIEKLKTS